MSAESPSSFLTYLGKIEATLLAGYMSQNCHENYGKEKMMQTCLRVSKKMRVLAHAPNMSCKVCILDWPKYQAS